MVKLHYACFGLIELRADLVECLSLPIGKILFGQWSKDTVVPSSSFYKHARLEGRDARRPAVNALYDFTRGEVRNLIKERRCY
jgi:hypothetical protein